MKKHDYDYNTQREHLVIREYGRHLQSMVEYTATIADAEKRNGLALGIIELMGQMNPGLRNVEEFRHKLWDHMYIISDGKLDVDSPYPKPNLEQIHKRPKHMGYPRQAIRLKHYGKNVERMIEKASAMEDEDKKRGFTECIGNYMKLVHRNWNKENANDEIIKQDIVVLSNGALHLDEDSNLDSLTRATPPRRKRPDNYRSNDRREGRNDNRGGHRGGDRNRDGGQGRHGGSNQGRFRGDNRNNNRRNNRDNRDSR